MYKVPFTIFGENNNKAIFASLYVNHSDCWLRRRYSNNYETWNSLVEYRLVRWLVRPFWLYAVRQGRRMKEENPLLRGVN